MRGEVWFTQSQQTVTMKSWNSNIFPSGRNFDHHSLSVLWANEHLEALSSLPQRFSDSQWPWWDENSVLWSLESVLFPLLLCCSESASVTGTWSLCLCLLPSSWGTSASKDAPGASRCFLTFHMSMNLCHHLTWASHCRSDAQSAVNSWNFCATKTSNLSILLSSYPLAHPFCLLTNHYHCKCFLTAETSIN